MLSTALCRWLFLLLSLSSWKTTDSKEMRVVCYYTNWSVYRPGEAKFTPQNINPYLCTHLIYAFGGFTKENTLKPFDKYQDIEKGGYAKFTGLKTYNKNLKTMLAIGGWNEGSTRFSPLVANSERRKELVKNSIKFLRQNHFDGLDLDWEYPAFRDGGKSRDRENYAQFVKELREEFERESQKTGRPRLLLTMAVPAGIEYVNKGYDVPKLTKYLDWMNILSYDYHSAFEPAVNHHAPLYPLEEDNEYNYDAELNIDYTIKHYLKLGADPSKLVLGIPTYGRSYTLYNPDAFEMGSPADGPGTMGEATRENGYLAYYEICDYIKNQEWEVEEENPNAMGPYAFKDNQWVGYDDESIVRKKAEYVAEKKLGGIMFWAIDNDDFRGNCHGKSYPLIEAGKEALLNAYGITDENLITPPAKPIKSRTRTRTKTLKNVSSEEKDTKTEKIFTAITNRRRSRVKPKTQEVKEEVKEVKEVKEASKNRRKIRRKSSTTTTTEEPTYSSLKVATPSYTTPAPPSTPDMQGAFKCEDEGFFPHPKDCKKYFWCLSGAGDSGIVAHQFTCPAGLYFNKAADSCDYSQNVLCNKKLQRATTSSASTTEASTTSTSTTTTTRAPSKIFTTTTKRPTTTTEAEYEYEYEDEEEEEDPVSNKGEAKHDEEDPQVIKELIELIRKAGGIEELEKQLKLKDSATISVSTGDATTETSIGKSLYERLFSKALKNTENLKKNSYFNIRNSRGPQNEGIKEDQKVREKVDRGKLQYTSISRQRPTTADSSKDEDSVEEDTSKETKSKTRKLYGKQSTQLEYVNIRRPRVSSTTEEPEPDSVINRNKVLGEATSEDEDEEEYDDEENEEEEEEESDKGKNNFTPQYVNIRRQRPSTTEEASTSKYVEIRRGTTGGIQIKENEKEVTDSKYKPIRRGSTSPSTTVEAETTTSAHIRRGTTTVGTSESTEETTKKYFHIRRPTTERITTTESAKLGSIAEKGEITTLFVSPNVELKATPSVIIDSTESTLFVSKNVTNITNDSVNSDSENISRTSSTESVSSDVTTEDVKYNERTTTSERISTSTGTTRRPSITEPPTQTSKVSQFNSKFRLRSKPESSKDESIPSNDSASKSTQFLRVRGSSRYKVSQSDDSRESGEDIDKQYSVQSKRKLVSTTEKFIEDRNYRPAELADLSSLTAVDFEKVKGISEERQHHRRRRPIIPISSTTSAPPEELDDSLKTGPRTLPLARKLISSSSFGKSRRINQRTEQDSTLSESNTRGTRTTREPSSIATATETYNTTVSRNVTPRPRRIIRKFRTTTVSPTVETIATVSSRRKVFGSINRNQSQIVKQRLFKQKTPQLNALQENHEDEIDDSFEDNGNDDEENIKLSESNIREHSDINSFNDNLKKGKLINEKGEHVHEKSSTGNKFELKTNIKREKTAQSTEQSSTESNIIGRTRKIIRKLGTTETTTNNPIIESEQHFGRKRKVIRRLRPIPTSNVHVEQDNSDKENYNITSSGNEGELTTQHFIRHLYRPLVSKENISSDSQNDPDVIKDHNETETNTNSKRILRPTLFTERIKFTRTDTDSVILSDTDDEKENANSFDENNRYRGVLKYKSTSNTTDINEHDKTSNGTATDSISIRNNVRKYLRNNRTNQNEQGRTRTFRPILNKSVTNEQTGKKNDDEEENDSIRNRGRYKYLLKSNSDQNISTENADIKKHVGSPNYEEESQADGTLAVITHEDEIDAVLEYISGVKENSKLNNDSKEYLTDIETETESDIILDHSVQEENKNISASDQHISGHYIVKSSTNIDNGEIREYGQKRILRPAFRHHILNEERPNSLSRTKGSSRLNLIKNTSELTTNKTDTEIDLQKVILEKFNNSEVLEADNLNVNNVTTDVISNLDNVVVKNIDVIISEDELKDDSNSTESYLPNIDESSNSNVEVDEETVLPETTVKPTTVTTEATTRRNNNFRRPQERPSFSRSKLTRVKTADETIEKVSKYRSFSRTTSTTTPSSQNENVNNKASFNRYRYRAFSRYNPTTTENPEESRLEQTTFATLIRDENKNIDSDNEIISYDISTEGLGTGSTLDIDTETTPYIMSTTEELDDIITTIRDEDKIGISTLLPSTDPIVDIETSTDLPLSSTVAYDNEAVSQTDSTTKFGTTTEKIIQSTSSTTSNSSVAENVTVQTEQKENSQTNSLATEQKNTTVQITHTDEYRNTVETSSSRPKFVPSKLRNRPSFSRPRLPTSTTDKGLTTEKEPISSTKKFGKYSNRYSTTERNSLSKFQGFRKGFTRKESKKSETEKTSPLPLNKLLYKYSTTEKYVNEEEYDDYDREEENDEYGEYTEDEDNLEKPETENKNLLIKSTSSKSENDRKQVNRPHFTKKQSTKVVNSPVVNKTTAGEEITTVEKESIKLRNKNLFSKSKTVNTPFVGQVTSNVSVVGVTESTSTEENSVTDSSGKTVQPQETTTESLTTLHHVFADFSEEALKTTTDLSDISATVTSKIEKLVEVNRIVKVKTKEAHIKNHKVEEHKTDEAKPVLDKVGAVNRIAVINVVDTDRSTTKSVDSNENAIHQFIPKSPVYIPKPTEDIPIKESVDAIIEIAKVQEIPAKPVPNKVNLTNISVEINNKTLADPFKTYREDRKFEIYSGGKLYSYYAKDAYQLKPEIIDGISHINIITPRPIYNTESSTISLEGLFQTKKPETLFETRYSPLNDELLDTENSKFVQVRVLHPDELNKLNKKSVQGGSKFIPYKHLKQDDEEVTMRAHVVEVKPEPSADIIKIIPIKVEMSKRVTKTLPKEKQNSTPT